MNFIKGEETRPLNEVEESCAEVEHAIARGDAQAARRSLGHAIAACRRFGEAQRGIDLYLKAWHKLGDDVNSEYCCNALAAAYLDLRDVQKARRYYRKAVRLNGGVESKYSRKLRMRIEAC